MAGKGSSNPVKHCDSVLVDENYLFPIVSLKAKSRNEVSHGESEARSFAVEKIQCVIDSLLLRQKISVVWGKTSINCALCERSREK